MSQGCSGSVRSGDAQGMFPAPYRAGQISHHLPNPRGVEGRLPDRFCCGIVRASWPRLKLDRLQLSGAGAVPCSSVDTSGQRTFETRE